MSFLPNNFHSLFLLLKWFKSTFYGVEVNRLVFYLVWVRVIIIHKTGRQHWAIGIRMSSPNSEIYDYNSKSLNLRWKKLWEWMDEYLYHQNATNSAKWLMPTWVHFHWSSTSNANTTKCFVRRQKCWIGDDRLTLRAFQDSLLE